MPTTPNLDEVSRILKRHLPAGYQAVLTAAAAKTGIATVVIRAPLVYGPGVRANFRALLRLCDTALPLPFGAVRNRRSLISPPSPLAAR